MAEIATVLLIDDHPLLRRGIGQLLALEPGLKVVGEADSGADGLRMARKLDPDIIVLDLNMPGTDGFAVLDAFKAADVDARVVVFTVSDVEADVVRALRAGADGYLLKDMSPMDMLAAIRKVAAGGIAISARLTDLLALALRRDDATATGPDVLTRREREILALIADGKTNKTIARDLGIALGTVKVHAKQILKKLGLNSRVQAAVWAVQHLQE